MGLLPWLSKSLQDGSGSLQDASKSSPGKLWKTPSHLQRLFRSGFGDPKPPPRALPSLQESRLPATSTKDSKSPRAQDEKNKFSHHSLGINRGSESACCHHQHHKMQSFSKHTTAKASFCITPKEIRRASGPGRVQISYHLVLVVVSYQVIFDSGAPQGPWPAKVASPTSRRPRADLPQASGERS